MRANGVRFQLFQPAAWDKDKEEILLHVKNLSDIINNVVHPPRPSARFPDPSLILRVLPIPETNPIDSQALDKVVLSAGWTIHSLDTADDSTRFYLELILNRAPDKKKSSVKTTWQYHRGFFSSRSANADPINLATALHARLVKDGKRDDLAIAPSESVPYVPGKPIMVSIEIQLSDADADFSLIWDDIGEGLKHFRRAMSPKPEP